MRPTYRVQWWHRLTRTEEFHRSARTALGRVVLLERRRVSDLEIHRDGRAISRGDLAADAAAEPPPRSAIGRAAHALQGRAPELHDRLGRYGHLWLFALVALAAAALLLLLR